KALASAWTAALVPLPRITSRNGGGTAGGRAGAAAGAGSGAGSCGGAAGPLVVWAGGRRPSPRPPRSVPAAGPWWAPPPPGRAHLALALDPSPLRTTDSGPPTRRTMDPGHARAERSRRPGRGPSRRG